MTGNSGNKVGTGGSTANADEMDFPAVPYSSWDFHSACEINYDDAFSVRYCQLDSLLDLNQYTEYVRRQLVDFLNTLVSLGAAGFRVDAAKHMWVEDLYEIYNRVNDLNTDHGFEPFTRPFFYQEVIDFSGDGVIKSTDYVGIGRVTEFRFSDNIGRVFKGYDLLVYLDSWGTGWGFIESDYALVFVDNHDNQRDSGENILTYKQSKQYKMATAFMLAHPYGSTRIMSSFAFDSRDQGPPADSNGNIISPGINDDDTCYNGWICEHRWRQMYNMVGFKNAVKGTEINNWWSNGSQQIAFCRGDKGFVAFTNGGSIYQSMQTCLPAGVYCDVISGSLLNGACTGKTVDVDSNGYGYVSLGESEEDGVVALHVNAKV